MTERSKLITDLVMGNINLVVALNSLLVITNEVSNKKIKTWIKSELNGYNNERLIPEYRRNLPYVIVYSGINGNFKMTNQPLPIQYLHEYTDIIMDLKVIKNSIFDIENNEGAYQIDLTFLSDELSSKTGIHFTSITLRLGKNAKDSIISNVKTKLIEALLLLEKEFGNLDTFFTNPNLDKIESVEQINKNLEIIIFGDNKEY